MAATPVASLGCAETRIAAPPCGENPAASFGAGPDYPSFLDVSRSTRGNRVDYEVVIASRDRASRVRGGAVLTAPLEAP